MQINIDDLTIRQVREIAALVGGSAQNSNGVNFAIGQAVIIRTRSAGVWFGELAEKEGNEVILKNARRMWQWFALEGISLSECSIYGIDPGKSRICAAVDAVWLQAIEILPCTDKAIGSIGSAKNAQP